MMHQALTLGIQSDRWIVFGNASGVCASIIWLPPLVLT